MIHMFRMSMRQDRKLQTGQNAIFHGIEVGVKGKGCVNTQPFHECEAGAVCITEVNVPVFQEDFPGPFLISILNSSKTGKSTVFQSFAEFGSEVRSKSV